MEIKQLKYFVVAADVGSFSEAANILFTTQSSVSKIIASLEKELDYALFNRASKGILLTEKGQAFYQKASSIVVDFDKLTMDSANVTKDTVRIGMLHSSWLANVFSDFYDLHKDEDVSFHIHTDGILALLERLKFSEDEISFVFVFPNDRPQVEYLLKKYNLRFVSFKTMDGMIYFAPEDSEYQALPKAIDLDKLKYIQSENDEYLNYGNWHTEAGRQIDISRDIRVITNSDYIMHNMLKKNHLANLSAESFNHFQVDKKPGIDIYNDKGQIEFGYVINRDYTPSDLAQQFIDYVRHAIEE